jgi:putative CRISPR-associated protein (TIGR02619 family)
MPRHLIVSCGTSQIDERKLNNAALSSSAKRAIRDIQGNEVDDQAYKLFSGKDYTEELITKLVSRWHDLAALVGNDNNAFGAEISTLAKMQGEGIFDPHHDSLVILYSDTEKGALCAGIVYRLLMESSWNVSEGSIRLVRVQGLREDMGNQEQAAQAEYNLIDCIKQSLKRGQSILVVTGGFKSVIPFFTAFALYYNVPMFYLFETSKSLRCVMPPRIKEPTFWQKVKESFSSGSEPQDAVSRILKDRADDPETQYGAPLV